MLSYFIYQQAKNEERKRWSEEKISTRCKNGIKTYSSDGTNQALMASISSPSRPFLDKLQHMDTAPQKRKKEQNLNFSFRSSLNFKFFGEQSMWRLRRSNNTSNSKSKKNVMSNFRRRFLKTSDRNFLRNENFVNRWLCCLSTQDNVCHELKRKL